MALSQYEVVFSESYIAEKDARLLIAKQLSSSSETPAVQDSTGVQSQGRPSQDETGDSSWPYESSMGAQAESEFKSSRESYESMWLNHKEYLCSIPIVEAPQRNETSEAEALAEEEKELARATDRGWELLQGLGGGHCLSFVSGWWSYSFCYGQEITQFNALPPQPGRPAFPPQRNPTYPQYVLGRVKSHIKDKGDSDSSTEVSAQDAKSGHPPTTELQVKGETRYLVQKLEGGTICDLTGKPRRTEVQFHCNENGNDAIGWIKEVTTCSYLMIVYTPRLCKDVAFLPPKVSKTNIIACQQVLPDTEIAKWRELKTGEAELTMCGAEAKPNPITVGGVVIGGGKYFGKGGLHLPLPINWSPGTSGQTVPDVIARSKGKADNNKVEVLSDEALQKMDLDPEVVEQLKTELQKTAGERGWRLEIVDIPDEMRQIRGIVDYGDEEGDEDEAKQDKEGEEDEGSEETYKEEL